MLKCCQTHLECEISFHAILFDTRFLPGCIFCRVLTHKLSFYISIIFFVIYPIWNSRFWNVGRFLVARPKPCIDLTLFIFVSITFVFSAFVNNRWYCAIDSWVCGNCAAGKVQKNFFYLMLKMVIMVSYYELSQPAEHYGFLNWSTKP